jgi:lipoprotein NlpI
MTLTSVTSWILGFGVWVLGFGLFSAALLAQQPVSPQELFSRAVNDFREGRVAESAAGFDRLAALVPNEAPELWQRGIALYAAGRYQDCRRQFESHRTVNPNDVENAAWHFLCVARAESPARAKTALLPVGPDARVPMRQVYAMFGGRATPDEVIAAAGDSASGQFYAELYAGLYLEAVGNTRGALDHLARAAAERYAQVGGYMHMVAGVQLGLLRRGR